MIDFDGPLRRHRRMHGTDRAFGTAVFGLRHGLPGGLSDDSQFGLACLVVHLRSPRTARPAGLPQLRYEEWVSRTGSPVAERADVLRFIARQAVREKTSAGRNPNEIQALHNHDIA